MYFLKETTIVQTISQNHACMKSKMVPLKMSLVVRKPVFGVSDWSDTNRAVQSLKMARGFKFLCIYEVEVLYYLCSENKGADQLRGYRKADNREADLRLCFRICKKPVFSCPKKS